MRNMPFDFAPSALRSEPAPDLSRGPTEFSDQLQARSWHSTRQGVAARDREPRVHALGVTGLAAANEDTIPSRGHGAIACGIDRTQLTPRQFEFHAAAPTRIEVHTAESDQRLPRRQVRM